MRDFVLTQTTLSVGQRDRASASALNWPAPVGAGAAVWAGAAGCCHHGNGEPDWAGARGGRWRRSGRDRRRRRLRGAALSRLALREELRPGFAAGRSRRLACFHWPAQTLMTLSAFAAHEPASAALARIAAETVRRTKNFRIGIDPCLLSPRAGKRVILSRKDASRQRVLGGIATRGRVFRVIRR